VVVAASQQVPAHSPNSTPPQSTPPDQDKVKISACYRLTTTAKAKEVEQQELDIRIAIDKMLERVRFIENQGNEMSFKVLAGLQEQCRVFEVKVQYSEENLFKPIDLEIFYELSQKVQNLEGKS